MSKKKFTEGLDSLFGDAPQDIDQKGNLLLFPIGGKPSSSDLDKGPSKNFTADLDSFLKEAFEEAFEETPEPSSKIKPTKKSQKSLSGLDALIRSTIEPGSISIDKKNSRRITFLVDQTKLETLKKIAKAEKAYLKDVISKIVEEYIDEYQSGNEKK